MIPKYTIHFEDPITRDPRVMMNVDKMPIWWSDLDACVKVVRQLFLPSTWVYIVKLGARPEIIPLQGERDDNRSTAVS